MVREGNEYPPHERWWCVSLAHGTDIVPVMAVSLGEHRISYVNIINDKLWSIESARYKHPYRSFYRTWEEARQHLLDRIRMYRGLLKVNDDLYKGYMDKLLELEDPS